MSMGGGMGRRGGGTSVESKRDTFITWFDATLTKPKVITPSSGESVENVSEKEHIQKLLHMSKWDPRPALVYFHYEHEEDEAGAANKAAKAQCKALNDEKIARWTELYICVEVDVAKSDADMLRRFGAGDAPSFAIINRDLEVVAQRPVTKSAKELVAFMRSTLTSQFAEYWKDTEVRLDEQREALKTARKLAKEKKLQEALEQYDLIRRSRLRVGDFFDDAVKEAKKLEKKLTDED
jgi:hypothetical protein